MKGSLQDAAKTLRFVRLWPRAVALMLGLGLVLWLLSQATDSPTGLVSQMPVALFGTAWAALTVHLATLRWAWRVDAGVLDVDRGSWLRTRRRRLARPDLRQLSHQLVYSSRTNRGPLVEHRRLLAHPPGGPKVVLTPALTGAGSAQLLAWHLQRALDASARSAPGDDGDKLPR